MSQNARMAPKQLTSLLLARLTGVGRSSRSGSAAAKVAALPAYQVALWPDGWTLEPDGAVHVCDTHEMAEARRWLEMAARNGRGRSRARPHTELTRTMRLHGLSVPRGVIDMAGRRFATEQVASVALTLVAGDWISQRRQYLSDAPERSLANQKLAWRGSLHNGVPGVDVVQELLQQVLEHAFAEALLPRFRYQVSSRFDDGFGIRCCRCRLEVDLASDDWARVREVVSAALIPWNRGVVRDSGAVPVIALQVRGLPTTSMLAPIADPEPHPGLDQAPDAAIWRP
ncbi:MAG: hypothetical protein WBG92_04725 [Thiohalocapsa sp.]